MSMMVITRKHFAAAAGGIGGIISLYGVYLSTKTSANALGIATITATPEMIVRLNPENTKVTMFQYEVCPFCNKLRAYLDYNRIPYEKIEVHPLWKTEIKFSTYRLVPFLLISNPELSIQVNGSNDAISFLNKNLKNLPEPDEDTEKWRQWVDNRLLKAFAPNIYGTPGEAWQAFDYISEQSKFSFSEKLAAKVSGAIAMYIIARRLKTKNEIHDARQHLYDSLHQWTNEGLNNGSLQFHGKTKPDLADLAVFGVIKALEGNYLTWKDLKANVKPEFWAWYDRVRSLMPY